MKAKSGFTLVEILIVVVILGILAAIVIPQFTEASTEAKTSRLVTDLQSVRSQIELYKIQHNDNLPGTVAGVTFEEAMTAYTLNDGTMAAVQEPADGVYGPYMQQPARRLGMILPAGSLIRRPVCSRLMTTKLDIRFYKPGSSCH
ncbi:MAG: type II secretion system protein [Planctomycetota bacterium]